MKWISIFLTLPIGFPLSFIPLIAEVALSMVSIDIITHPSEGPLTAPSHSLMPPYFSNSDRIRSSDRLFL